MAPVRWSGISQAPVSLRAGSPTSNTIACGTSGPRTSAIWKRRTRMPPLDISVVVTTYERPLQLARLLETLALQDYPKDLFEVMVVDDGGSESLKPVISRFQDCMQIV